MRSALLDRSILFPLAILGWWIDSTASFQAPIAHVAAAVHHPPHLAKLHQQQQHPVPFTGNKDPFGRNNQKGVSLSSSLSENNDTGNNNNNNNLNKNENNKNKNSSNWDYINRQANLFVRMAGPYYEESIQGRWLLAGLLGLTLLNSGVSVMFSYLGKDFWNALSAKEASTFYDILLKYVGALAIGAPIVTLYKYQREQLAVHWREWMTVRTFELYTNNRVYYNLERRGDDVITSISDDENSNGETTSIGSDAAGVDNPDQRIAEDVKTFTAYSLQLVITILTSMIDLASFSTILYSIYPQLFGAIIIYAAFGTLVTAWLGQSLVGLNYNQLQREADFRYSLVRLRDNAESIAFYGGEDLEGQGVTDRVEQVVSNRRSINAAQRNLEFFTTSYRYLVQVLPVAVVAPKFFAGEIALGVISQSAGAFAHVLNDLTIIISQFESLSSFSAGIDRLAGFYEAMREVDIARDTTSALMRSANATETAKRKAQSDREIQVDSSKGFGVIRLDPIANLTMSDPILSIQDLDLCTPDKKRLLIRDLSFHLMQGENLLIVGNSGSGKSSLLRGIAGLWTNGNGSIQRPRDEDVYFLPQRPYCTVGSLRDQLLYPSVEGMMGDGDEAREGNENDSAPASVPNEKKVLPKSHLLKERLSDQDLMDILEQVDLIDVAIRAGDGDPIKGLNAKLDWSNRLSLGEQQRLAFGRLLVNRPQLVILDEATSALDMVSEARMYSLLQTMGKNTLNGTLSAPGMTYISVGHRPSLVAFHDKRLRLGGDADHELSDLEKQAFQIPTKVSNL